MKTTENNKENLFVKNSAQDQDVLIASKKFLDNIVGQIKDAYSNVLHCYTDELKDSTVIEIGCHPNKNCTHSFKVDKEGIITYTSDSELFFDKNGKPNPKKVELLKKYPESTEWKGDKISLVVKIKNETDFVNKVKDIAYMMEKNGFVLKR